MHRKSSGNYLLLYYQSFKFRNMQREYTLYSKIQYNSANAVVKEAYDDITHTLQLPFVLNWFNHQRSHLCILKYKLKHTIMEAEL